MLSPPCVLAADGAAVTAPAATQVVDLARYIKADSFNQIKISPSGDYYAATVPLDNGERTALLITRRADNSVSATFMLDKNTHVADFAWVNPERVLLSMAEKFGALDEPQPTGELYAINADGSRVEFLVGQRLQGAGAGTRIQPKKAERVAAFLVDDLPDDDQNVVISVSPFSKDPYTRAELMDVYTGRRVQIASAPVRRASFITDNQGVVRFALGADTDNAQRLYYRQGNGADWQLINDEAATGMRQHPIGFAADDATAYLRAEQPSGPDAIIAFDVADQSRKQVLRDDNSDPARILYRSGSAVPVGALLHDGKPRTAFFDDGSKEARLYRSLEAAFGNQPVLITSQTADGKVALVQTWNDRNPGDFYLFDNEAKTADLLLSRAGWIDPRQMAATRPIELAARDGLPLHGYLTVPKGSDGKSQPMVVLPHGGPFGERDTWGFAGDVQMLADAGYTVLRLNFRGSGGYGKAFQDAGARQWGKTMQDDLTDATHWAIEQGIADPERICIYGASYGAYAALMGAVREPSLYRCAVGYVGVYDLPTMHTHGDIQQRGSGETFLNEWIGERDQLGAVSPTQLASRIKVPVFLAAGGEDERTPIEHSEMMERALRTAGVPVETLYYDTEGHGFYTQEHRREYYTRLLAFLSRNLGGGVAATDTGGGSGTTAVK
ncbi:MAG: alpha/beta hydrolase family protein [Lysobacter sp.]